MTSSFSVGMYGGGGTGKTAITIQFVKGEFTEGYIPTIEDTFEKVIQVDGKTVELQIVDTAGQDDFQEMRENYMKRVDGFIFVFSLVDIQSLDILQNIYTDSLKAKGANYVSCVIAANKADLKNQSEELVDFPIAQSLAEKWKCHIFETSARTCQNISQLFEDIVHQLLLKNQKSPPAKEEKGGKGCCLIC